MDEIAIPLCGAVKIVSKRAVYKWIDNIAESKEDLEMKVFQKQRQYILGAYSFEAELGAVPVFVEFLMTVQ